MFFFNIPLKSRKVSKDWALVTRFFEQTLSSVFNQSNDSFRVFVACHDIPETRFNDDPRLTYVQVDFPPPLYKDEFVVDKHKKREVLAARLRAEGGGYAMDLDADDLVSRRLVAHVLNDANPYGYVVKDGYEYDYGRQLVRKAPRFNKLSGSCSVIRWEVKDLPEIPYRDETTLFRETINNFHPTHEALFAGKGRPLAPVPFRAVAYMMNNSENISVQTGNVGWRRALLRRFTPAGPVSKEFAEEFGLKRTG